MNDDSDNLYTHVIDDSQEGTRVPIPPCPPGRQLRTPEPQHTGRPFQRAAGSGPEWTKRPFQQSGAGTQGPDKNRMDHLKKLYDSITKINRGPLQQNFITQARKFKMNAADSAVHVPFSCYWPTYEAMSQKQKDWYFYWRRLTRSGEYPDTDLSYIFLHIYELINNVDVEDGRDGFMKLCALWSAYRGRYPSLDRYMVPWIQDYVIINSDNSEPSEMLKEIPDRKLLNLFPDYILAEYINNPEAELPIELISRFSDYKFYMSKFCVDDKDNLLLKFIPAVFRHINRHFLDTGGKGIFDMYKPERTPQKRRIPYQNAIYQGGVEAVTIEQFSYVDHKPLRELVTSVIKHLENKLREKTGFKGRLRGFSLDQAIVELIDRYISDELRKAEAEKNTVKVQIDREKIIQLINDSNIIRQKLLEGIDEDMEKQETGPEPIETGIEHNTEPVNTDMALVYTGTEPGAGDAFAALIGGLSDSERKIAGFIAGNAFEAGETELACAFPGVFIQMDIDNINNRALDTIGDILIVCEAGKWIVCDDYREELSKNTGRKDSLL